MNSEDFSSIYMPVSLVIPGSSFEFPRSVVCFAFIYFQSEVFQYHLYCFQLFCWVSLLYEDVYVICICIKQFGSVVVGLPGCKGFIICEFEQ